jgi:hypothetical protein
VGFHDFATYFLDEALFQDVGDIDNFFFMGDAQVALGIFSPRVAC